MISTVICLKLRDPRQHRHQVVQDPRDLAEQRPDPLCPLGYLDIEQLLHGEGITQLVGHCRPNSATTSDRPPIVLTHGHVIEPVKVWERLSVIFVLDQLLRTAMKQSDVRVCSEDLL